MGQCDVRDQSHCAMADGSGVVRGTQGEDVPCALGQERLGSVKYEEVRQGFVSKTGVPAAWCYRQVHKTRGQQVKGTPKNAT